MKVDITNTSEKYDIIYADPPWAYLWGKGKQGGNFCPERNIIIQCQPMKFANWAK